MTRVLVTGANGFVGRVMCDTLTHCGFSVRAALRNADCAVPASLERIVIGEIGGATDWTRALDGIDSVVHLAARAHILGDSPTNSDAYFETNARGTQRLASQAARAGTRRIVYLSSVKVNGEETAETPFSAADRPDPQDAYGASKWSGESLLTDIAAATALQAVIVRSPLVYGPGVRANFLRMMQLIDRQIPLPLGAIHNRRSLVSVWNLCDLLANVLVNRAAPGQTWMVSDGADMTTPELLRRIGRAMNRRVCLLPVSVGVLRACGTLLGRKSEISRLCCSLAIDIAPTREKLSWSPPLSVEQGISRTVDWYLHKGSHVAS